MEGSQGQVGQPMGAPQPQHSNLIRTDQVQKLPHLSDQQKAQHTQLVRSLWDLLNTRDPQTHEYQQAHTKLSQLSQNLMKGMRAFQQNRQQAMQQHQHQQGAVQQGQPGQQQGQQPPVQQAPQGTQGPQGQPVQRTQSNNPQTINQLIPQIQARVSALNFFLPPNVTPEQVQTWIPEARLRYGIALQKQEVGRARMADLRSSYAQRQAQGNMSQEEMQEFKNRQLAAEKLFREGSEFLNKFKEQQESFKIQSQQNPQNQAMNQAAQANTPINLNQAPVAPPVSAQSGPNSQVGAAANPMQPGQPQPPAPHTINSAVNAARQTAMSPSASQPGQPPSAQSAGNTPVPISAPLPQAQRQQPPSQQGTPGGQLTFSQTPHPDGSTPHTPRSSTAAQTYTNPTPQQQTMNQQAQANQQAHPQGYLANRPGEASTRNTNMAIPKNLHVSTPEPVSMPGSRPSLSGGPSHSAMGMMGQPAIQKHPGYVLEGEGQRVLSKKMLDILVRQVTGGGEGEMLTPDAEEFILQMADDFVDEVITQACRLAKLRPSSTLELRDIQLVLERNYNMRISGFSTDDLRTVKKPQPTQGWTQKMSAIQAAKVTQGKNE
ncbi:Histone-fold [Penicillium coprophilum]|uniref:Histone-fold n=1 Tax=Penicillium coprophilum TaxID=36646 RepID=UPI00239C5B1B|nr:Histone-fold [Penicillium coprophilum]KAJ5154159.1 Histone-fold [Penicillium coprophilum]